MENEYNEPSSQIPSALVIDLPIKGFLTETVKWGKFLAILGFVFTGLIGLISIVVMLFGALMPSNGIFTSAMGYILGPMYLTMALLYYFPSRFLYKFCHNVKEALILNDQETLTLGFEYLKSNFKFWGIAAIIMIILYIFGIVATITSNVLFSH